MNDGPAFVSTLECPYCTSLVTTTTYTSGRLGVHHHEPWREGCEAGLRRLLAEAVQGQGLAPVFRHDN